MRPAPPERRWAEWPRYEPFSGVLAGWAGRVYGSQTESLRSGDLPAPLPLPLRRTLMAFCWCRFHAPRAALTMPNDLDRRGHGRGHEGRQGLGLGDDVGSGAVNGLLAAKRGLRGGTAGGQHERAGTAQEEAGYCEDHQAHSGVRKGRVDSRWPMANSQGWELGFMFGKSDGDFQGVGGMRGGGKVRSCRAG